MTDLYKSFLQQFAQYIMGYKKYLILFGIYQVYKYRLLRQDKELKYFIHLIGKSNSDIVIDAGANIGYTSIIFSKWMPNAKIIAFEPVKIHTEVMGMLVKYFKITKIVIRQMALGNKTMNTTMVTPVLSGVKKQGFSFVKGEVYADKPDAFTGIEEVVYMSTLDSLLLNHTQQKIAAIKIDVENYEVFVLEGAAKLIATYQPIVFAELWENERKWQCIELMKTYGYTVNILVKNQLVAYTEGSALNYFFLPKVVATQPT